MAGIGIYGEINMLRHEGLGISSFLSYLNDLDKRSGRGRQIKYLQFYQFVY